MASIDVGIHPDPARIKTQRYAKGPSAPFSTVKIATDQARVSIFVSNRAELDALQAALDAIRADMIGPGKPDGACIDPLGHEHHIAHKAEAVA